LSKFFPNFEQLVGLLLAINAATEGLIEIGQNLVNGK
jgi:hypothetical protein